MRRIAPRLAISVIVVVAVVGGAATVALASFTGSASQSQTVSTATLAPPTNPATANGPCTVAVSASIVVSWTPTTSSYADGYEVLGSLVSGGPYSVVATVSGQATSSATVSGLSFATTYYYVVRAKKSAWRSANTSQVSRTTLSALCT